MLGLLVVYFFLSSRISRIKTATIAMIMAADTGRKYRSAMDAGIGVGSGVAGGASSTNMDVSADEPQYDLEPENVAIMVYLPGTGGSNVQLKKPLASLVAVATS